MTEVQRNIAVANSIIDEFRKDKPFVLKLNVKERKHFLLVLGKSKIDFKIIRHANGCDILIEDGVADRIYHMLSSYIAKHDLPESVVESLGEVS